MRLYLSSFRVGAHGAELLRMVGAGRRAALAPNAIDDFSDAARDVADLSALGFSVWICAASRRRRATCCGCAAAACSRCAGRSWARGAVLAAIRADAFVYGGYSAGVCVLSPDLRGLEAVDPPGADPLWSGLGLLDRPVVPHVDTGAPGEPGVRRAVGGVHRRRSSTLGTAGR